MPATSEITRTLTGEIVVRVTAIGATDARALLAAARTGTPALRKAAATAATNLTHLPAHPGAHPTPVRLTGREDEGPMVSPLHP